MVCSRISCGSVGGGGFVVSSATATDFVYAFTTPEESYSTMIIRLTYQLSAADTLRMQIGSGGTLSTSGIYQTTHAYRNTSTWSGAVITGATGWSVAAVNHGKPTADATGAAQGEIVMHAINNTSFSKNAACRFGWYDSGSDAALMIATCRAAGLSTAVNIIRIYPATGTTTFMQNSIISISFT